MAQKSKQSRDPGVTQALKKLAGTISKAVDSAAVLSTGAPGLTLYRNTAPTTPNHCTYEPSLLLIPQGKKRVDLGKQSYVFGESTFLLTSIELPIVSRVCVASVEKPYLAFFLKLDMGVVRDVLHTEEVRISASMVSAVSQSFSWSQVGRFRRGCSLVCSPGPISAQRNLIAFKLKSNVPFWDYFGIVDHPRIPLT